jgi:hypothetical protein
MNSVSINGKVIRVQECDKRIYAELAFLSEKEKGKKFYILGIDKLGTDKFDSKAYIQNGVVPGVTLAIQGAYSTTSIITDKGESINNQPCIIANHIIPYDDTNTVQQLIQQYYEKRSNVPNTDKMETTTGYYKFIKNTNGKEFAMIYLLDPTNPKFYPMEQYDEMFEWADKGGKPESTEKEQKEQKEQA